MSIQDRYKKIKKNIKNESEIIMIRIKENINNVDEFNLLYDSVGWGAYDKKNIKKSIK